MYTYTSKNTYTLINNTHTPTLNHACTSVQHMTMKYNKYQYNIQNIYISAYIYDKLYFNIQFNEIVFIVMKCPVI